MTETALIHAECGRALRAATGEDGSRLLECRACDCAVVLVATRSERGSDEVTAVRLAHYLALKYEIELLDAVSLVRRHLDTAFAAIDRRESTWIAGDVLASLERLRQRPI